MWHVCYFLQVLVIFTAMLGIVMLFGNATALHCLLHTISAVPSIVLVHQLVCRVPSVHARLPLYYVHRSPQQH